LTETELHGEPFYAVEKTTYCEKCYIASLEKCTVCSETIADRVSWRRTCNMLLLYRQAVLLGKNYDI